MKKKVAERIYFSMVIGKGGKKELFGKKFVIKKYNYLLLEGSNYNYLFLDENN